MPIPTHQTTKLPPQHEFPSLSGHLQEEKCYLSPDDGHLVIETRVKIVIQ